MSTLAEKITTHLSASPKNEILLSGPTLTFLKASTVKSIVDEEGAVRINGTRYFESQIRYWEA